THASLSGPYLNLFFILQQSTSTRNPPGTIVRPCLNLDKGFHFLLENCMNRRWATLTNLDSIGVPSSSRLEGKYKAILVSWFLGMGSLVSWNWILTIGYYYYNLFLVSGLESVKSSSGNLLPKMERNQPNLDQC
ncbi:equilibrative nucleotide transporter 3-like isoform X1, partial [Olea europaea subsp. europaea]